MSHSIDHRILEEAAQWMTQIQEGSLTQAQQLQFEQWRNQSQEHLRAWRRAERLLFKMGGLPPALAHATLEREGSHLKQSRRTIVRSMASVLALAPLGWLLWRNKPWYEWLASDYVTPIGERAEVALADGSRVDLNTDTALDVYYSRTERLLRLRQGEIHVATGADTHNPVRPFLIQTQQGVLEALGTRFSVRQNPHDTLLGVYEGAVQIRPSDTEASGYRTIGAGQKVRFTSRAIETTSPTSDAATAWRNGLLMADEMPLPQWAAELARYSHQTIEIHASAQHLRVSGAFPTNDLPQALRMLAHIHRLRIRTDSQKVRIER